MVNHLNEGQCQLYLCDFSELVNLAGARQTERGTAMRRKEHFLQILKKSHWMLRIKVVYC